MVHSSNPNGGEIFSLHPFTCVQVAGNHNSVIAS